MRYAIRAFVVAGAIAASIAHAAERTIQQSFVPPSGQPDWSWLRNETSVTCKILTVGPNGTQEMSVTLYGDRAARHSNGMCWRGAPLQHVMVRVAAGSPDYDWVGAWVKPGSNPILYFWANGQLAYGLTARTWLDLSPGRIALQEDELVQLDARGNVIYVYKDGDLQRRFPNCGLDARDNERCPLPARDQYE